MLKTILGGIMKKLLSASLLATAAMAAPAFAQDADHVGGYVQIRAGLADAKNPNLTFVDDTTDNDPLLVTAKANQKSAATFGGEIGYDFGPVRLGVELAYNRHKINALTFKTFDGDPVPATGFDELFADLTGWDEDELDAFSFNGTTVRAKKGSIAKQRQLAVMANATFDIPVDGAVQPYVGAGLGGVSSRLSGFGEKDSEFKFAWQLRAGAAFTVSDGVAITADYTYRQSGKTSYTFDDTEAYRFNKSKLSLFQLGLRADF